MRAVALLALAQLVTLGQIVLKPDRVFDGETVHEGWAVLVKGDRIESAGPAAASILQARRWWNCRAQHCCLD